MIELIQPQKPLLKVFIHGSFANAKSWRKIIDHLNEDNNIEQNFVTVNLPGHGGTMDADDYNNPNFEPEFDALRKIIADKIDLLAGVHLIGHSFGGVVALAAAMDNIFPIKKLTLFEPVAVSVLKAFNEDRDYGQVVDFVEKYKTAYEENQKMACRHVIDFWGGTGSFDMIPNHIQVAMENMTKNNLRHWDLCQLKGNNMDDYKNINIPTQLIYGSKSNPIAKLISTTLNEQLPISDVNIIDDASHFMITTHSEQSADILKNK